MESTTPRLAKRTAGSLLLALTASACSDRGEQPTPDVEPDSPPAATADCGDPAVRDLVQRFGERLRGVSLLAPDSVVAAEMRAAYEELVAPELLSDWLAEPAAAPGREVSSPWPRRIEISSVDPGEAACVVRGEVIYATSADTAATDAATTEAVTLTVTRDAGWRISAYEATEATPRDTTAADTAAR